MICFGSAHLHACGEMGVGAAEGVDFGGHQVLKLAFHLVVGDDFIAGLLLDDLAHHKAIQARMAAGLGTVSEEMLQILQFY